MGEDLKITRRCMHDTVVTRHNNISSPLERDEAEPNVDRHPIPFRILQIYPAHLLDVTHDLVCFCIVKARQKCLSSK